MGHARSCGYLHPRGPHQGRHPEHSVVDRRRRGGVLHGSDHPVRDRADPVRVGRGQEMGGHHQARKRECGPGVPEQQADGDRRGVPGRVVVRPVGVGADEGRREAEGSEDPGDQERQAGDAGGGGRRGAGELHPHGPHRQLAGASGRPRTQHHLRTDQPRGKVNALLYSLKLSSWGCGAVH